MVTVERIVFRAGRRRRDFRADECAGPVTGGTCLLVRPRSFSPPDRSAQAAFLPFWVAGCGKCKRSSMRTIEPVSGSRSWRTHPVITGCEAARKEGAR